MIDKEFPYRLWKLGEDLRRYAEVIFINKIDGADSRTLYFMIGHSFELILKAFLLTKGFTEKTLCKKKYGHNLTNLFVAAKKFNEFSKIIRLSKNLELHINEISDYHKDMDFKYIVTGIMFLRPPKILFENLDILINECEKICEDFINIKW